MNFAALWFVKLHQIVNHLLLSALTYHQSPAPPQNLMNRITRYP